MTLFSRFGIKAFGRTRHRRRQPAGLTSAPAIIESLEDRTLLAAPTLLTPTPGYTTDSTPAFDWSDVADADEYHLWVNDLNTGESGVIFEPNLLTSDHTPMAALTVGHSYIWTAAGINGGVYDDWAAHQTFTVRPEAPELTGPTELITQSLLLDRTPTLTWSAVAGADHYDVAVNNLTTGEQQVIRNTNVVGTELVSPIELEIGHNYIWSVRAVADTGVASEWAAHKVFTAIPEAPTILGPIGGTTDTTPELTWSPVAGADHYVVWVNDLTTGESAVIYETNVMGESFTPAMPLDVEHQYLWTVRAVTSTGYGGQWAAHSRFFIDGAADSVGVPTLLGPFGHTVDDTPTFVWTAVPNATSYELIVTNLTTGEYGVVRESGITETSFAPDVPLEIACVYTYSVRAYVDDAYGAYATPGVFTLDGSGSLLFETPEYGHVTATLTIVIPDGLGGTQTVELQGQPNGGETGIYYAAITANVDNFDNPEFLFLTDGVISLEDPLVARRPGIPGSGTNIGLANLAFERFEEPSPTEGQIEVAVRGIAIDLPEFGQVQLSEGELADYFDQDWTITTGVVDVYVGPTTGEGDRTDATGGLLVNPGGFSSNATYIVDNVDPNRHLIYLDVVRTIDLEELGFLPGSFMTLTSAATLEFINPVIYLPEP